MISYDDLPPISRKGRSNDVLNKTEKKADDEHKSFDLSSWKAIAKSKDNLIAIVSYRGKTIKKWIKEGKSENFT